MSDVPEITDRESLEAWLEARPREDAVVIAHRAAMRVLPAWLRGVEHNSDLTALPILRCDLISGVARKYPTPKITTAAYAAATATTATTAATSAYAAARAAYAAARPAYATAYAATATTAATSAYAPAATAWLAVEADRQMIEAGGDPLTAPLWPDENPLADLWPHHAPVLDTTPGGPFWIDWYQRALDGTPQPWPLLKDIALIEDDLWIEAANADPGTPDWTALDDKIRGLVEQHQPAAPTALSQASPVEFDFDEFMQHMNIVGFSDDVAHLRDPAAVTAFLQDAEELRDGLTDFLDFAADLQTGNTPLAAVKAGRKLLAELKHCASTQDLGARRLIMLGRFFADEALDQAAREKLGPGLTNMMDSLVDLTRQVYRKHLAPSLVNLRPLMTLELGDHDPDELLTAAEHLATLIENADNTTLARMSPEALAVMQDFLDELRGQRTGIAEARTPEGVAAMRKKFAEVFGAVAVAYGRYAEKGRPYVAKVTEALDWLVKVYKRWTTFTDVYETLSECPCKDFS